MNHTEGEELIADAVKLFEAADINIDLLDMKLVIVNGENLIKIGGHTYSKTALELIINGTD